MAEIAEYMKENLKLSFASWSQGQKVGSLAGFLIAGAVTLLGSAGIAFYLQSSVHRYWPLALGFWFLFTVLVITPFRMWRYERNRVEVAEAKLRPKFKCSFDNSPGCQHPTKFKLRDIRTRAVLSSTNIRMFRIRVEAEAPGGLKDCRANLISLKRGNRVLFDHDALPLTIAPAERPDPLSRDVRDNVPEHVDLFCLTERNEVLIYPPGRSFPISIHPDTLFTGAGEYRFHVVISAADSASAELDVVLKWTGDWHTAEAYAG